MDTKISPVILEKAPLILAEIKKASSILLHCHPSPDPDSVGSALAMKFALEQLGKKATVIKGDSEIPEGFMHFPGAKEIVKKNFFEINLADYDLFLILDSASTEQISRFKPVQFPLAIRSVVIDHHATDIGYADLNLVEASYPAVSQILFELFGLWQIKMNMEIATNLFMGIYTDTGGFQYEGVTAKTFEIAAELIKHTPSISKTIAVMKNSNKPEYIYMQGLAFNSVETFFGGKMALSVVSASAIREKGIPVADVRAGEISPILNRVSDWEVVGTLFEVEAGKIRASFRTHDSEKYDVSKLAAALGGGGHKAAAGAILNMPLAEAKNLVVAKAKELYNL